MNQTADNASHALDDPAGTIHDRLGGRSVVLIGMMGAGKSSIGRRLAARLNLPFVDADTEIEKAAGRTINEIFAEDGEAFFRSGERRVIARLLGEGPQVLATGGGAILSKRTRTAIADHGISVWLKADLALLMKRVRRRSTRPLLKADDPEAVMRDLMTKRDPLYALADITVESRNAPHADVVDEIVSRLSAKLEAQPA